MVCKPCFLCWSTKAAMVPSARLLLLLLLLLLCISTLKIAQALWTRPHLALVRHEPAAGGQVSQPLQTFKPDPSILREGNPTEFNGSSYYQSGLDIVGNERVLICHIRKVASRVVGQLEARIDGIPDWHSTDLIFISDYMLAIDERNTYITYTVDNRPPTVVMVRNPVTRLLSAYVSKVEGREFEYCRDPTCPKKVDSFEELIRAFEHTNMKFVNKHFTLQVDECGFEMGMTYDCVIDYDNRADGWKQCLTKLGLWEEFGASGWGPDGDQSLFAETEILGASAFHVKKNSVTIIPDLLERYYTPELLKAVFKIYRKDFEIFGYPMDVAAYLKPPSEAM